MKAKRLWFCVVFASFALPSIDEHRAFGQPSEKPETPSEVASEATPGSQRKAIDTSASGPFINIEMRWPSAVVDGINQCKQSMDCPTLLELKDKQSDTFAWVSGWCRARSGSKSTNEDEKRVCFATENGSNAELGKVSILSLSKLALTQNPPQCSGFGLTIPLYSIRYHNGTSDVKGPVAAGLGGGYYWVPNFLCHETFSAGPEFFGYSEGLDPSGLFHVGIAAGLQLAAYKYFQFGLDLGYDLYRRQPTQEPTTATSITEKSGLFDGSLHRSDFTVLITFSVTGATTSSASGK